MHRSAARNPEEPQVTAIHRLAVVNRGEAAMRCLSAVAELNCEPGEPIETIALVSKAAELLGILLVLPLALPRRSARLSISTA